ncbi:MAG: sensor histidine kinase, partial [Parvibaculales bacterium]
MPKKAKTAQPLSPELLQAQKLQAIGALAGGVAHDFNNLLTVIIGHTDMLLHRHLAGDPSFADIVQIKENAQRAAHLTRQLLAFSRKQTLREENFSPETLIENLKPLLSRLLGEKVKLDIRCRKPLWNCFADARQLEQAIINLLVNARDAMEGEGVLTLTLYMEKGRIIWEVADSGKGMDAETKEKAFTPFFTTKALGEGTGLGLAMVHGFVLQSGGEIELHSALGKGTT